MTVIEQAVADFVERVHENIKNEKDMVTTGSIANLSIQAEDGVVKVFGPAHLIYQDRGVNGAKVKLYSTPHSYKDKMPPPSVFREWVKAKKLFLTDKNDLHRRV